MNGKINPESTALINVLSMNYRYAGGWNEVNTRIAQRQNALNIYVTLATGVVTILFASGNSHTKLDPNVFSLLIPIISLVFGFLNYKHDKTIALLREFLSECELCCADKYPELALIGYNSNPHFKLHAEKLRKNHDIACSVLIIVYNAIGLYVAYKSYPDFFVLTGWPIVFIAVVVIASVFMAGIPLIRAHKFDKNDD